jgi:CDP-glycerol glycerophosphotransferase (TagB/SpsB family)
VLTVSTVIVDFMYIYIYIYIYFFNDEQYTSNGKFNQCKFTESDSPDCNTILSEDVNVLFEICTVYS